MCNSIKNNKIVKSGCQTVGYNKYNVTCLCPIRNQQYYRRLDSLANTSSTEFSLGLVSMLETTIYSFESITTVTEESTITTKSQISPWVPIGIAIGLVGVCCLLVFIIVHNRNKLNRSKLGSSEDNNYQPDDNIKSKPAQSLERLSINKIAAMDNNNDENEEIDEIDYLASPSISLKKQIMDNNNSDRIIGSNGQQYNLNNNNNNNNNNNKNQNNGIILFPIGQDELIDNNNYDNDNNLPILDIESYMKNQEVTESFFGKNKQTSTITTTNNNNNNNYKTNSILYMEDIEERDTSQDRLKKSLL